jgi:hypothetical protein
LLCCLITKAISTKTTQQKKLFCLLNTGSYRVERIAPSEIAIL